MIKINLLPKIVNEKIIIRNMAIMFAALLLVVIAVGVGYSVKLAGDVAYAEQRASETEAYEQQVKAIQLQTATIVGETKPIQDKLEFINNVLRYNQEYPKLYAEVAKWTYEKVELVGMSCNGTEVTLQARVKSLEDLGRYLLNMYQASNLFTEVKITQAGGFGSGGSDMSQASLISNSFESEISGLMGGPMGSQAGIGAISGSVTSTKLSGAWMDVTVACKLKTPIVAPIFAAPAAATGAPGAPAPPTPPMGGPMGDPMAGPS